MTGGRPERNLMSFEFSILILSRVDLDSITYFQILDIRLDATLGDFHLWHELDRYHFVLGGLNCYAIRGDGFDKASDVFEASVGKQRSGQRQREDGGDDSVCHGDSPI